MVNRLEEMSIGGGYDSLEDLNQPGFFQNRFPRLYSDIDYVCQKERYYAGIKVFGNLFEVAGAKKKYHYDCTSETLA